MAAGEEISEQNWSSRTISRNSSQVALTLKTILMTEESPIFWNMTARSQSFSILEDFP